MRDGEGCARLLVQIVGVIHSGVAKASGAGGRGRRERDNQAVKAQHFQLRVESDSKEQSGNTCLRPESEASDSVTEKRHNENMGGIREGSRARARFRSLQKERERERESYAGRFWMWGSGWGPYASERGTWDYETDHL